MSRVGLASAAAILVACLIGAGFLLNGPDGPGSVSVDVAPADAADLTDTPATSADPDEGTTSSPQDTAPATSSATDENTTPDPQDTAPATSSDTDGGASATDQTTPPPPARADGGLAIAVGTAVGISPDGTTALVSSVSPFGGTGCEGETIHEVWRVPFDGSTPTLAAEEGLTVNLARLVHFGDRAAWTVGCDGYVGSVATATISPDGALAEVGRIDIADQVSFDPLVGRLGVLGLSFDDQGQLQIKASNGINAETLSFSGTELVGRTPEDNFDWIEPDPVANDQVRLENDWDTGLVIAHSMSADNPFEFRGSPIATTFDYAAGRKLLAIARDYRGGWIAESEGDCATRLVYVPFDGSPRQTLDGVFPADDYGLSLSLRPTDPGVPAVVTARCGGATTAFVGSTEDLLNGSPLHRATPPLWWMNPNIESFDGTVARFEVSPTFETSLQLTYDSSTGTTGFAGTNEVEGARIYNARFAFVIEGLPGWTMNPPPTNNDGRVLTHTSGAQIAVFGTHGIEAALDREVGFNATVNESVIDLTTLAQGELVQARRVRSDWGGSGVPLDFTQVVVAAADRAVVLEANMPMENTDARAAVEAVIASLDVHAHIGG